MSDLVTLPDRIYPREQLENYVKVSVPEEYASIRKFVLELLDSVLNFSNTGDNLRIAQDAFNPFGEEGYLGMFMYDKKLKEFTNYNIRHLISASTSDSSVPFLARTVSHIFRHYALYYTNSDMTRYNNLAQSFRDDTPVVPGRREVTPLQLLSNSRFLEESGGWTYYPGNERIVPDDLTLFPLDRTLLSHINLKYDRRLHDGTGLYGNNSTWTGWDLTGATYSITGGILTVVSGTVRFPGNYATAKMLVLQVSSPAPNTSLIFTPDTPPTDGFIASTSMTLRAGRKEITWATVGTGGVSPFTLSVTASGPFVLHRCRIIADTMQATQATDASGRGKILTLNQATVGDGPFGPAFTILPFRTRPQLELGVINSGNALSFSLWVKLEDHPQKFTGASYWHGKRIPLVWADGTVAGSGIGLVRYYQNDTGNVGSHMIAMRVVGSDGTIVETELSGSVLLTKGQWTHLVGTWDGVRNIKLFVNGILASAMASSVDHLPINTVTSYMTVFGDQEINYVSGAPVSLDTAQRIVSGADLRVYNQALNSLQAQVLANEHLVVLQDAYEEWLQHGASLASDSGSLVDHLGHVPVIGNDTLTISVTGHPGYLSLDESVTPLVDFFSVDGNLMETVVGTGITQSDLSWVTKSADVSVPSRAVNCSVRLKNLGGASPYRSVISGVSLTKKFVNPGVFGVRVDLPTAYPIPDQMQRDVTAVVELLRVFRPGRITCLIVPVIEIELHRLLPTSLYYDAEYASQFLSVSINNPEANIPMITDAEDYPGGTNYVTDQGAPGIFTDTEPDDDRVISITTAIVNTLPVDPGIGATEIPCTSTIYPDNTGNTRYATYEFFTNQKIRWLTAFGGFTLATIAFKDGPEFYTWVDGLNIGHRVMYRLIYRLTE